MEEIEKTLREYGLSEKEAKVYLTLTTTGSATANKISEKADLVRTTTYDILKALREKGIVSSIIRNKILYFEAAPPDKLIQTLEEKKQKIRDIIPDLKKLKIRATEKPVVELYEGKEGIKTVYQDILQEKKPLCAFSNTHFIFNVLPFFVPRFIKKRMQSRISIKLLNEKTRESINLMKKRDKQELRETRFVPRLKNIPLTEYIYGNKVAILSTKPEEPLGVIINHLEFAKSQQLLFDLLWEKAEK
ncbi:hypothetical protein KY348_04210 [Candidatus Woesearchaeota archaeon]|nr:hypothetical protein [Candidatus Woesearchaeota archaeon]